VYVDGFNLYYRTLKYTPYKWLNIAAMCNHILADVDPAYQISRIKYYTAPVKPFPNNLQAPSRQQIYSRALRTLPNFQIIQGTFLLNPHWAHVANPPNPGNPWVEVLKSEEKGSDVNLASHMIRDGFRGFYDAAILVTNRINSRLQ